MAYGQKPPPFRFDPKNPTPPLDLEKIFREENINMKAILDSRKLTKEIDKTLAPYTGELVMHKRNIYLSVQWLVMPVGI